VSNVDYEMIADQFFTRYPMVTTSTQKVARRPPTIKMHPSSDRAWWDGISSGLLAFVITSRTGRTWSEIYAWGRARRFTDTNTANQVAHLDLTKQIERVEIPSELDERGYTVQWIKPEPDES
jgi:hypothetical protein